MTEDEIENGPFMTIKVTTDETGAIKLTDKDGFIFIRAGEVSKAILKLRQMEMTLKRRQE